MEPTQLHAIKLITAGLCFTASLATAGSDAQRILAASDAVRNPGRPFSVNVTLTEFQAGKRVDTSTLKTYSRVLEQGGQFASIVRFVSPPRDADKLMLKNGNDLWFFDPATRSSVRLSPQQRLLGQASNGDVATVNLARDYKAALVATGEIQDGERQARNAHQLELVAAGEDATYARIDFWVDADNSRPLKGRFFAESGRLLKTVYYRRFLPQLGSDRPTEIVIIDGLDSRSVTLMRLSDYTAMNLPSTWFQREYLPQFQPE